MGYTVKYSDMSSLKIRVLIDLIVFKSQIHYQDDINVTNPRM